MAIELKNYAITLAALICVASVALSQTQNRERGAAAYQFLVSEHERGGVLYRATAGGLRDALLPLSFVDSAAYWGEYVCGNSAALCSVVDRYSVGDYTLRPEKSAAGDLQTERVNIHNGTNIYDAATWQIAVMLGAVRQGYAIPGAGNAYALVNNQNRLLQLGYGGDAKPAVAHQHRATTAGEVFVYNGNRIVDPERAFVFRTVPRSWLSLDPLSGSRFAGWITAQDLPIINPIYQRGKITWTDWKPIAGENAWAFLIGPLQSARLQFIEAKKQRYVPFAEVAVQNALAILPTFAAMQSPIGAVYYAPAGTVVNQGDELVNRYEVAVENNFSLYAGLKILRGTLQAELDHQRDLSAADKATIDVSLRLIEAMLNGGVVNARKTEGLLAFFKKRAWRNGEFVQGGFANDPANKEVWIARTQPRAVDVNTWGIAALGAQQIDAWFGFGAAFNNWQRVKAWGGYGVKKTLWGVGFSDRDGNGIDAQENYRQGVMSAEWTAGAVTAVRQLQTYYGGIPQTSPEYPQARQYVEVLRSDEQAMLQGLIKLRRDQFVAAGFPGIAKNMNTQLPASEGAYLYASRRYLIPFGWYANPLPSVCSTAWAMMVASGFDPFQVDGR